MSQWLVVLSIAAAHDLRGQKTLPVLLPNVAHLARSPASIQLASEFMASERQRLSNNVAQQSQTLRAKSLLSEPFNLDGQPSEGPQFSLTLPDFRMDIYHPLEEINDYLAALARRHPRRVKLFTLGHTHEGRPIKALEITTNATNPNYVWLDALTHAREWVTGSTVLYIVDQIVGGRELAGRNFLVIPVVNPDGYSYTWTTNRMWRKNRSKSPPSKNFAPSSLDDSADIEASCIGADLNRNYDHPSFGGAGASQDSCSHIYSGPYAFSEAETRSIGDLMWSLKDRIKFYLTIHSYNQLWACPYAHTLEPSPSLGNHMRVLRAIQRAVQESQGVQYEIGPLGKSLYVGSGFGIDFAYDRCGIEHSYLVELRDKGAHGFLLPADQIMPVARETLAGLRAGLRAALG